MVFTSVDEEEKRKKEWKKERKKERKKEKGCIIPLLIKEEGKMNT